MIFLGWFQLGWNWIVRYKGLHDTFNNRDLAGPFAVGAPWTNLPQVSLWGPLSACSELQTHDLLNTTLVIPNLFQYSYEYHYMDGFHLWIWISLKNSWIKTSWLIVFVDIVSPLDFPVSCQPQDVASKNAPSTKNKCWTWIPPQKMYHP